MAIIIDLIIVALLAISIFIGYYKGLTKSLIRIFSFVIAIVVAAMFFKPVSNLVIDNTEIDDKIRESIISLVIDDVKEDGEVFVAWEKYITDELKLELLYLDNKPTSCSIDKKGC